MPTSFDATGRPGYIYNLSTDTWHQISGKTDTTSGYEWGGDHDFLSTVDFKYTLRSQHGLNNFLNPAARDAAITTPTAGSICLIRQDAVGNTVYQVQIYANSTWQPLAKMNQLDDFIIQNIMGVFGN